MKGEIGNYTQLNKLSNNKENDLNDNKDKETVNQSNDSDEEFFFNYRSDVLFNKINKLDKDAQ